jgi:hypothetical protein
MTTRYAVVPVTASVAADWEVVAELLLYIEDTPYSEVSGEGVTAPSLTWHDQDPRKETPAALIEAVRAAAVELRRTGKNLHFELARRLESALKEPV